MHILVGMGFVGDESSLLYRMSPREQGGDTIEGVFFISESGEYFTNESGMYFVETEV